MRVGREQMLSRDYLAKIKKLLKAYPRGLSITSISHKLSLNRNSVSRLLDVLLITGYIEMQTIGASKVFRLTQRVPISSLLSFSSDLILVLDLDGHVIQVNDNFLDFFGIDKENFWKKDPQAVVTGILQNLNVLREITSPAEIKAYREASFTLHDRPVHLKLNLLPTVFDDGQKGITIIMENLTELRRLEEMDAFLASIVASSDDAIIGKTLEGTIVSWNEGAKRIYGYSAEEIIGRNIAVLTPPGYEEELDSILGKVQNGERVHHFDTRRKTKAGIIIDVSVTISPIRDKSNRIIGASTIARDITETVRTGRDLLIRNSALDRVASGVILTDTTNRIFYANPAFLRLSGVGDPADILGRRLDQCWQTTDTGVALFQGMYGGLQETGTWFGEIRLQRMDGRGADLQIYASVIPDLSGAVLCTMTYCIDVTDHKRVEKDLLTVQEQMRHIIEFLPDPTFIIDDKGTVIAWNTAMAEITGKKAEEILGKGEYAYALPFYGEGREVLIDLIGEPAEKIYARYPKARISHQNIYAEVYAPQLP
ncbi:MAG: PAS domain S-box protein, partial [Methanomicrobiales archaeon]|nr:PAS domain S-box protein [Methanomicrobiales archaeon]